MPLYKQYIFKLFFSRIGVVLFAVVLFSVFKELTMASSMLSISQILRLIPLVIPQILFQFMPFIYFGTMLLVMNELYSNNELVIFKTLGISHRKLMNVFMQIAVIMCLFSFVVILLYPKGLSLFYKYRNAFKATNVITILKPHQLNNFGQSYKIFFRRIDSKGCLLDAMILTDVDENNLRLIYADKIELGNNVDNQLVARCDNMSINVVSFDEKEKQKSTNIKQNNDIEYDKKNSIYNIKMKHSDILFDALFGDRNSSLSEKQIARRTGFVALIKQYINKPTYDIRLEFHSRLFCVFMSIISITLSMSLLLKRQTNRIHNTKLTIMATILGAYFSSVRSFELESFLDNRLMVLFYLQFFVANVMCACYVVRINKKHVLQKPIV